MPHPVHRVGLFFLGVVNGEWSMVNGETPSPNRSAPFTNSHSPALGSSDRKARTYVHAMTDLERIAAQRILVLDGAMGTMIQKLGLTEEDFHPKGMEDHKILLKGNNELLSLSRPEAIRTIHEQYLEAVADIVETNTFSAASIAQAEQACSHLAPEMNLASLRVAK